MFVFHTNKQANHQLNNNYTGLTLICFIFTMVAHFNDFKLSVAILSITQLFLIKL